MTYEKITNKLKFPNPGFVRKNFRLLNGEWEFDFDDEIQMRIPVKLDKKIKVPYSYETLSSGIGDTSVHPVVWYQRIINLKKDDGRILLHFEAVDYECTVYLNNLEVGSHVGGFTAFCFDITEHAEEGENLLTLRVKDSLSKSQLRGKQRARHESYDCWYIQTTGIWKNVWLEYCGSNIIKYFKIDTRNDGTVNCQVDVSGGLQVEVIVDGQSYKAEVVEGKAQLAFKIENPMLWSPKSPFLYEIEIILDGPKKDSVLGYFAFRNVSCKKDGIYLNNEKVYLKMVLDQGYWNDTMLTLPDNEALIKDINYIIDMGFNGVRKHQKVESYAFYYLCDVYGLLVWAEIPSAYEFDDRMKLEFERDSLLILKQLYNFPSIITWIIFNESWGIPHINCDKSTQDFVEKMQIIFKENCGNSLISINDGWFQLDGDIISLHEYEQDSKVIEKEYANEEYVLTNKIINGFGPAFIKGKKYSNQPVIISEFGGISICGSNGWGYGEGAETIVEYIKRFSDLLDTVKSLDYVSGFCYTQLTDVQQEVNGLLTSERTPKIETSLIRKIINKGVE